MSDQTKLRRLVYDCRSDLVKYLVPDSGISEKEVISRLLARLDGPQAREAMGELTHAPLAD